MGQVFQEKALSAFPFFNIYEANLLELSPKRSEQCRFYYQQIHENFQSEETSARELIKANLQAILWLCNQVYEELNRDKDQQKESLAPHEFALSWLLHFASNIISIPGTSSQARLIENLQSYGLPIKSHAEA
ncbi:MAG: hypothetical protein AAF634_01995 [Bacteroidota bacterium]